MKTRWPAWALFRARGHFCGLHSGHGVNPWRVASGRAGYPPRGTHHPHLPMALPNVHLPGMGAISSAHASAPPNPWSSGQARAEASGRAPKPVKGNAQMRGGRQPSGSQPHPQPLPEPGPFPGLAPSRPTPPARYPQGSSYSGTAGSRVPGHQHWSPEGLLEGQVPGASWVLLNASDFRQHFPIET